MPARFSHVRPVRFLLGLVLLYGGALLAQAQEQEKKLLDRLLKPDTTLQNPTEGKEFVAGGATVTKRARTKSFFFAKRKPEKEFWNTKSVSTTEFRTPSSPQAKTKANLKTRGHLVNTNTPFPTADYSQVRTSPDAERTVAASEFSGSRPFLGRGKSQKSLSAQDRPLTIDEVRELLNKNK